MSTTSSDSSTTDDHLESSSSTLRFPAPLGDHRVNTWVESILGTKPNEAHPHSRPKPSHPPAPTMPGSVTDEGMLGESAYEFIDTDTESRDGATESVNSTDFEGARPDDVASLADTEGSDDDEEEEEEAHIPPAVEEAFNTPTIGRSSHLLLDEDKSVEIQFEEPFSRSMEVVSVKHTVAELNEEETRDAIQGMTFIAPPKRMVVTIRQTMTKARLSTKEPLRLLYVGSHSARQDIIHKIATSVTASVGTQRMRNSNSQIYNVVPLTAFGSDATPEIELMQGSGYQLKVEDCILAESTKRWDDSGRELISLAFDGGFHCDSRPTKEGYAIEPAWELPHVAIFYCSNGDDVEGRSTRTLARKFMSRHGVPSIVISHKQLFGRGQCMSLDQHSIHMCLESRDSNGRGNIIHRRLPIDLASFLNIDARQMNRNLAYLTGLHESEDSRTTPAVAPKRVATNNIESLDLDKKPFKMADVWKAVQDNKPASWRTILLAGLIIPLSIILGVYTGVPISRNQTTPAILLNSKVMSSVPVSSTSILTLTSSVMSATSTSLPSIATSTRTVTVTQSAIPGPNSLSVFPSKELSKLSKCKAIPQPELSCSASILGDREILIRIPSATKLTWGNREAISINITRQNATVDTERFSFTNEGIILLLPKREAWGVLNVSIITTKKPRVNENFELDFGSEMGRAWAGFMEKLCGMMPDADLKQQIRKEAEYSQLLLKNFTATALEVADHLAEAAKVLSFEAVKRSAIISKELGIRAAEANTAIQQRVQEFSKSETRKQADDVVLAAQVRSKIVWLRMLGKHAEAEKYEKKAVEEMKKRAGMEGKKGCKAKKADKLRLRKGRGGKGKGKAQAGRCW